MPDTPFSPTDRDPYEINGIPRAIVKSWILRLFGAGKLPKKWTPGVCRDYAEETGGRKLGKDYPIREVGEAILSRYQALRRVEEGGIDCFDLMFLESEIIIQAVLTLLRQHGIPCLPVHDSLIVPQDSVGVSLEVLRDAFEAKAGARPTLRVEGDNPA
jgi:hypothetical protein